MPPQEGLHPVFRWHGFVGDFVLANLRAAHDEQVDRFFGRHQGALDRQPRDALGG